MNCLFIRPFSGLMMGMAGVGASVSPQLVEASIAKVVAWTSDVRSAEVRKASQDAIYALFSLHPAEVTRILNTLPKVCQVNNEDFLIEIFVILCCFIFLNDTFFFFFYYFSNNLIG
jgi:hypothetical protein